MNSECGASLNEWASASGFGAMMVPDLHCILPRDHAGQHAAVVPGKQEGMATWGGFTNIPLGVAIEVRN